MTSSQATEPIDESTEPHYVVKLKGRWFDGWGDAVQYIDPAKSSFGKSVGRACYHGQHFFKLSAKRCARQKIENDKHERTGTPTRKQLKEARRESVMKVRA